VPYELLTGDLSQVNYSSIRAGLVEFRRQIDAVHDLDLEPALSVVVLLVRSAPGRTGNLPIALSGVGRRALVPEVPNCPGVKDIILA
jgi:hypothetical protein